MMVLIYGFIRGVAYALRKLAEMRHKRVQRVYERHEEDFTQLDGDRKLEEVGSGQPVGYALQYKLLKSYEAKEQARQKWVAAANRLTNRQSAEAKIKRFSGLKLPVTTTSSTRAGFWCIQDRCTAAQCRLVSNADPGSAGGQ